MSACSPPSSCLLVAIECCARRRRDGRRDGLASRDPMRVRMRRSGLQGIR